jgi:hypothetical protein
VVDKSWPVSRTANPVTQVALSSGHSSLRRFNAAFVQRYRMNPTSLRKQAAVAHRPRGNVLRLAYRPPYDIGGVFGFLARRAVAGVEAADGAELRRTLAWEHQGTRLLGWLQCRFEQVTCRGVGGCRGLGAEQRARCPAGPCDGFVARRLSQSLVYRGVIEERLDAGGPGPPNDVGGDFVGEDHRKRGGVASEGADGRRHGRLAE